MVADTIAALATAPGRGAIGLIRVSGPEAHDVLRRLAPGLEKLPPARVATVTRLVDPVEDAPLDQAVVVRFDAPESYTGEDMVEISTHGGWLVPAFVLDACRAAGAREAEPGEFTRRAYLHGKMDLVQAEAVADLVEARSPAMQRASLYQLEQGLSRRVGELRDALIALEAHLAHHIDFPEEDDAPVPIEAVVDEAEQVLARMDRLLETAPQGELLREGAVAVLAGRPNAGKSSLYNALVGEERAIVTEVPGTTRDALESTVSIGGYPFRLVDTAGLRDTEDRVEQVGIEVARRSLEAAHVVLLCTEADAGLGAAEAGFLDGLGETPVIWVQTKADLAGDEGPSTASSFVGRSAAGELAGMVRTSVTTGQGLAALRELLADLVYGGAIEVSGEVPLLTRRRHTRALRTARGEVAAFRDALREGVPAEVAASHLRPAETALEEVLGVVAVEDVLDVVFSSFCIGK